MVPPAVPREARRKGAAAVPFPALALARDGQRWREFSWFAKALCLPFNLTKDTGPIIPAISPFEALGGIEGVQALVKRFYDLVETAPEAAALKRLHGPSLESAREKLTLYLTGWTGGPSLYVQKYGHPMLRARHLPFSIGAQERDEWLWCMERALSEHDMPDEARQFLMTKLRPLADHMRNRAE